MFKTLPALAALAASLTVVTPAIARADETASARISYADLNLVSQLGKQKLQSRIAFAARSVCDTSDVPDPAMARAVSDCRTTAVANAQPAYREALIRALHPSVTVMDATALIVTAP